MFRNQESSFLKKLQSIQQMDISMDQTKIEIATNMERSESEMSDSVRLDMKTPGSNEVRRNLEIPGFKTVQPDMVIPRPTTAETSSEMPIVETAQMSRVTATQELSFKMCDKLLVGASTFTGDKLFDLPVKSTQRELPSTSQSSSGDGFIDLHPKREKAQNQTGPETKPKPEQDSERGSCYASSCFNPSTERGYRDLGQVAVDDDDYAASNAEQDTFCFIRFGDGETVRTGTAGSSNVEVDGSHSYKSTSWCSVEVIPNFLSKSIPDHVYEDKPRRSIEYIPNILSEHSSSYSNVVTPNCSVEVRPNFLSEPIPDGSYEVTPCCEDSKSCSNEDTPRLSFEDSPSHSSKELSVKKKSTKARFLPYPEHHIFRKSEDKTANEQDCETAKERFQRPMRIKEVKDKLRKMIKKRMKNEDQDNRVSATNNIPNFDLLFQK